jgi:Asp-tRNA(Asn)/Glu-tRNA(Gln) amidotransferase A subunit family amidase
VIPLGDGTSAVFQPELGPELCRAQPRDLAGRFYSAADYHELYKSGELTPRQMAEALLQLIRRDVSSPSEYSKAWVHSHEDKVLAAADASTERWAAGKPLGILDGVPIGVKDDINTSGYVTTMGMKVDKSVPFFNTPADSTVWPVKKLEEAGAIVMGKMNMQELGMGESSGVASVLHPGSADNR